MQRCASRTLIVVGLVERKVWNEGTRWTPTGHHGARKLASARENATCEISDQNQPRDSLAPAHQPGESAFAPETRRHLYSLDPFRSSQSSVAHPESTDFSLELIASGCSQSLHHFRGLIHDSTTCRKNCYCLARIQLYAQNNPEIRNLLGACQINMY